MENLNVDFATIFWITIVLGILLCIGTGLFLNIIHRLIYGKETIISYIPLLNIYILGKITINKDIGILLVFLPFALYYLPFSPINHILLLIYFITLIFLFIIAGRKLIKIKTHTNHLHLKNTYKTKANTLSNDEDNILNKRR